MRALVLFLALVLPASAAAQTASYPVVTWLNDGAHEAVGARVLAVLAQSGLHPAVTCSLGCTLSVPSAEYAAATRLATELVAREHLDVSVVAALPTS